MVNARMRKRKASALWEQAFWSFNPRLDEREQFLSLNLLAI